MAGIDDCHLLEPPSGGSSGPLIRAQSTYHPLHDFDLAKAEGYQQQFGDIYFLRLAKLKPEVEKVAAEAWEGYTIADESVQHVDRVLAVRQGMLCWIIGTIYLDMPLKPNILADIAADNWIAAPPSRERYVNPHTGEDKVLIEDESGRLRLTGAVLKDHLLVTGVIVAVMGTENRDGEFEVVDLKIAGLAPQPGRFSLEPDAAKPSATEEEQSTKIALLSGLELSGDNASTLSHDLLLEFLTGEAASISLQNLSSQISRLVVLGNSLAESNPLGARDDNFAAQQDRRKGQSSTGRKYGYDSSTYNPAPTTQLDDFFAALLPSLPITIMPGESDPANVSIPQQPLHPALFPRSRAYADPPAAASMNMQQGTYTTKKKRTAPPPEFPFHSITNPAYLSMDGQLCLFSSGQPTIDIMRYLSVSDNISTLDLMESTLQWRLIAPTAPDTLWCYPYQNRDPFVIGDEKCPVLYAVGNSEQFDTRIVQGSAEQWVRLISVPNFSISGEIVIVDLDDLSCQRIKIGVENG